MEVYLLKELRKGRFAHFKADKLPLLSVLTCAWLIHALPETAIKSGNVE